MVAGVEDEGQADQVAELRFVTFRGAHRLLLEAAADAQVAELLVQGLQGGLVERVVHADHVLVLQPAAGVVVAVEAGNLLHGFLGTVYQAHQVQVAGHDVAMFLELLAHELQGAFPVAAAGLVEQDDGHQRALAGLDQGQHLQRFIQGAEAARAEHQGIGLLDEEQLAQEEEVEGQQVVAALDRGIGALLEGQGDVEAQAVVAPGALMGGGHDAAAGAGDHHQVVARQGGAQLQGHGVQRVVGGGCVPSRTRSPCAGA